MTFAEIFRPRRVRVSALFVWTLCATLLALQFTPQVSASGGRDFAGIYDVTNVTSLGDDVRLTFSARVFNYSDSDVFGATVTLRGPGAPDGEYAAFYAINLRDKESVYVSRDITIPKQEYERWRQGQYPLLAVEFQDLSGASQSELVELANGTVGEE